MRLIVLMILFNEYIMVVLHLVISYNCINSIASSPLTGRTRLGVTVPLARPGC
jgi:hypothetical protein